MKGTMFDQPSKLQLMITRGKQILSSCSAHFDGLFHADGENSDDHKVMAAMNISKHNFGKTAGVGEASQSKFSSGKVLPYIDLPPVPLPAVKSPPAGFMILLSRT